MRGLAVAAVLAAGLAVAALANAESHPSGHYVGHTTCGAGSPVCPKQRAWALLKVHPHEISEFLADVTCRRGSNDTRTYVDETLHHVKIDSQGNFNGATPPDPFSEQLRIHGHIAGGVVTGKIEYTDNGAFNDTPDEPSCDAHHIGFTAKFRKKPLFKPGNYSGVTHCSSPASNHCTAQSNTISFTATKYAIKQGKTVMNCVDDNGKPYTYNAAFKLPIRWNGVFVFTSLSQPDASLSLGGRIKGAHAKGQILYDGDGVGCVVGFQADLVP